MIRAALLRRLLALGLVTLGLNGAGTAHAGQFDANTKGSLFYISNVELRWTPGGTLIQNTFVHLYNDFPQPVRVLMYFINGDAPDGQNPGWNRIDMEFQMTSDQPLYWSMATGLGNPGPAIAPFTLLDPGNPPGRLDPEGSGEFVLRGYIVGWAVNNNSEEIRWNHLAATATVVNYQKGTAWGYNGYHAQTMNLAIPNGSQTGTPGMINFDGFEYAQTRAELIFNFPAVGSRLYSSTVDGVVVTGDLTLHPAGVDLRQNGSGPVLTNANFRVWNENEVLFTGMNRCVNCWDQRIMDQYAAPNFFTLAAIQTDVGWARVDGKASQSCTFGAFQSQDAPMFGVVSRNLTFESNNTYDDAGYNLSCVGFENSRLLYDVPVGASTLTQNVDPSTVEPAVQTASLVERARADQQPTSDVRATERGPVTASRFTSNEAGNLVIWSKVELRWNSSGALTQDTFMHLTNIHSQQMNVRLFFINGDPPLAQQGPERAHPGWNALEHEITLTQTQPAYWSAARGSASLGISKWTELDPGSPPGRPDPENQSERMLRGFIIGWAVNSACEEVAGALLLGDAIVVDYAAKTAWGYNAYHMPNIANALPGEPTGITPGVLALGDTDEFASAFSQLMFAFPAVGSLMYSAGTAVAIAEPDLTFHVVDADLTANSTGPLTTKGDFVVWNMNEVLFSGLFQCVTCWDETLLRNYNIPNHFLLGNLQTNMGKARLRGLQSNQCNTQTVTSTAAALLGVMATTVDIDFAGGIAPAKFGNNLFGAGEMPATIRADACVAPPCPWDIGTPGGPGQDGVVNVFDLFVLLSNWNMNGPGAALAPPNNIVDVFDLFELLANWGPCP